MTPRAPLRIAIVGTRGIPANYGGFETFAQELSIRLARQGHAITVYCRAHYCRNSVPTFEGVALQVLPALRLKYFDTISHTFLSVLHLLPRPYDAVLVCNAANAFLCVLPRLFGKKVILNVDGLERKRKKWNWIARTYYLISERVATVTANAIVTDARVIQSYFQERYGTRTTMIPYGGSLAKHPPGEVIQRYGLKPDGYYLYVSRLEPENNARLVISLFERLRSDRALLIVGDAPYSRVYIDSLKQTRDPRIIFTGAIYGEGYRELISNAFCYIHATEVGGTHPALVENMAVGNTIFYLDTPENREVAGDAGISFSACDPDEAAARLQQLEDKPERRAQLGEKAIQRVMERYSWEAVTTAYLDLFRAVLKRE